MATAEKVLALYREQYFDFNVRHFHEKLREEHGIALSYTWVKNALQEGGLVGRAKKRGRHHKRRPRRPLPGMMLHIDGSTHAWLGSEHERFDPTAPASDEKESNQSGTTGSAPPIHIINPTGQFTCLKNRTT
jgi:hypothetical protein